MAQSQGEVGLRALTARQGATKLPLSLQVLQKAQGGQAVRNLAVRTAAAIPAQHVVCSLLPTWRRAWPPLRLPRPSRITGQKKVQATWPTCLRCGVVSRYLAFQFHQLMTI